MLSLHITVDLHLPVNNIKTLSVVMETKEWFSFALFLSYELFRTGVNNMNLCRFMSVHYITIVLLFPLVHNFFNTLKTNKLFQILLRVSTILSSSGSNLLPR